MCRLLWGGNFLEQPGNHDPEAQGMIKTERRSSKYLSKPEPNIKVVGEKLKENRRNERAAADGGGLRPRMWTQ